MTRLALTASLAALGFAATALAAEPPVTGEARQCLLLSQVDHIRALDEHTFMLETGNAQYLTTVEQGCERATSDLTYIQFDIAGSELCSGDVARVIDRTIDTTVGSCALGDFHEVAEAGDTN